MTLGAGLRAECAGEAAFEVSQSGCEGRLGGELRTGALRFSEKKKLCVQPETGYNAATATGHHQYQLTPLNFRISLFHPVQ